MKFFKILHVSSDFSTNFLNLSLASVGSAPEPPTNSYFQNFLNLFVNFRENRDKILQVIAKFPLKFSKNINFLLFF